MYKYLLVLFFFAGCANITAEQEVALHEDLSTSNFGITVPSAEVLQSFPQLVDQPLQAYQMSAEIDPSVDVQFGKLEDKVDVSPAQYDIDYDAEILSARLESDTNFAGVRGLRVGISNSSEQMVLLDYTLSAQAQAQKVLEFSPDFDVKKFRELVRESASLDVWLLFQPGSVTMRKVSADLTFEAQLKIKAHL